MGEPALRIERIRRDHDRADFDCGNAELSDFLRKYARQNDELGLGRTFVAVREGDPAVLGYHTLRHGEVEVANLRPEETKRFPRYPVPVVHFARLAVDKRAQGQRLGETLLLDGLERALAVSRTVAAYAVEVVAIDEAARAFYVKYGFQELKDDRRHLYLPMRTIEKLFGSAQHQAIEGGPPRTRLRSIGILEPGRRILALVSARQRHRIRSDTDPTSSRLKQSGTPVASRPAMKTTLLALSALLVLALPRDAFA